LVSIDSYCSSVGALDILFFILKGHHLGFYTKVLPPLEQKLLVMLGRIVSDANCLAPIVLALESVQHISANW
jgi:hypothetical protein